MSKLKKKGRIKYYQHIFTCRKCGIKTNYIWGAGWSEDYKRRKAELCRICWARSSQNELTHEEIKDLREAWKEIKEGRAKEFSNVHDFLEELKEEASEHEKGEI